MTGEELINMVKRIVTPLHLFLDKRLTKLSDDQLRWKPNANAWSIHDILCHVHAFTKFYNDTIEKKIASTRFRSPTNNFQSSPLGRATWRSVKLGNARNVKRKFRSQLAFNPIANNEIQLDSPLSECAAAQTNFVLLADRSKEINLRKAKVHISGSKIIKFRLGDVLLFVAYHADRHYEQMKNLMQHPAFPKK